MCRDIRTKGLLVLPVSAFPASRHARLPGVSGWIFLPLDAWTRPLRRLLPLADPALRRNLNTPADWQSFLSALPS